MDTLWIEKMLKSDFMQVFPHAYIEVHLLTKFLHLAEPTYL